MKIFAISDLHLSYSVDKPMDVFGAGWANHFERISSDWSDRVSDEDIVLIAGDISWAMNLDDAMTDIEAVSRLSGYKYMIRGNHDYWWSSYKKIMDRLPEKTYCIQNNAFRHNGYVFCGTRGWSLQDELQSSEKKYIERECTRLELGLIEAKKLATDGEKIICMIHYPPYNAKYENSCFTEILEKFGVSAVVYGHLHDGDVRSNLRVEKNGIAYYLTSCDLLDFRLAEIII